MTNEEAAKALISLYAAWSRRAGNVSDTYELAVAYAVAALAREETDHE